MNIHEHQAKALLATYGLPVARGVAIFSADEAEADGVEAAEAATAAAGEDIDIHTVRRTDRGPFHPAVFLFTPRPADDTPWESPL